MKELLKEHDLILMEAAVVERLRRDGRVALHPRLVHATLLYDDIGRHELERIYQDYVDIARDARLPLLLCTPTWRANRERVHESAAGHDVNSDAVRFLRTFRDGQGAGAPAIEIGGLIGCKNDCYRPQEGLSALESEAFHSWQIDQLATAGVDFLIAETLPGVHEALGIARAMAVTELPYVISFVINREGRLLDRTPLWEAVTILDEAAQNQPMGFMVNCAHPSFLNAETQPRQLFARLIGYQANASSRDQADLDGQNEVQVDDVSEWGRAMLTLNRRYGVKVLGGCCGTGVAHLEFIAANWRQAKS
jgi:S-methylmethionine-dependent homocysteine/selenocysteine methylase